MTYTSAVGAPSYQYTPAQTQGVYQTQATAVNPAYQQQDAYQARYQYNPGNAVQAPQEEYKVINKSDLMLGAAGAVGGFFLAGMIGVSGPIGALILGIALLGLSAGIRGIKHMSQKKQQQQMTQAVHPGFQQQQQYYQYPGQQYSGQSNSNSAYTPAMQQYNYQPQTTQAPAYQANYTQQQGYPQQQAYAQRPVSSNGNTWGDSAWEKFLSWL